jgi:histidinol-phosphate/aromatic aminotransferase/cobyric acid decarboxylase-like protein
VAARNELAAQMSTISAHWELSELGNRLAAAQAKVATLEESWLALASEAEDLGLTS